MKLTSIIASLLALAATTAAAPIAEEPAVSAELAQEKSLLKRGNCVLHAQWDSNWSEAGWRRYRVRAWADVGGNRWDTKEMLSQWLAIAIYWKSCCYVGVNNLGQWLENDNLAFVDLSFWEGSEGHNLYLSYHQDIVNRWRDWSNGCDVYSSF